MFSIRASKRRDLKHMGITVTLRDFIYYIIIAQSLTTYCLHNRVNELQQISDDLTRSWIKTALKVWEAVVNDVISGMN